MISQKSTTIVPSKKYDSSYNVREFMEQSGYSRTPKTNGPQFVARSNVNLEYQNQMSRN